VAQTLKKKSNEVTSKKAYKMPLHRNGFAFKVLMYGIPETRKSPLFLSQNSTVNQFSKIKILLAAVFYNFLSMATAESIT
jgi:hypothetical protein